MQTDHDREMDAVHDRMQLLQEQLTHWVGARTLAGKGPNGSRTDPLAALREAPFEAARCISSILAQVGALAHEGDKDGGREREEGGGCVLDRLRGTAGAVGQLCDSASTKVSDGASLVCDRSVFVEVFTEEERIFCVDTSGVETTAPCSLVVVYAESIAPGCAVQSVEARRQLESLQQEYKEQSDNLAQAIGELPIALALGAVTPAVGPWAVACPTLKHNVCGVHLVVDCCCCLFQSLDSFCWRRMRT
jgi:hypothetical protein